MFTTETKEVFLVLINSQERQGLMMMGKKDDVICIFQNVESAKKSIAYDYDTSSAIHLMSFNPTIIRIQASTKQELNEAIMPLANIDDKGMYNIISLSNISGKIIALETRQGIDWAPYIVDKIVPKFPLQEVVTA